MPSSGTDLQGRSNRLSDNACVAAASDCCCCCCIPCQSTRVCAAAKPGVLLCAAVTGPQRTCHVSTHAILAFRPCEGTAIADLILACSMSRHSRSHSSAVAQLFKVEPGGCCSQSLCVPRLRLALTTELLALSPLKLPLPLDGGTTHDRLAPPPTFPSPFPCGPLTSGIEFVNHVTLPVQIRLPVAAGRVQQHTCT